MERTYLITGAKGMLGRTLMDHLQQLGECTVGTDLPECDLTSKGAAPDLLDQLRPTHIIHCAAYTNVDGAEAEREACFAANVTAPRLLAEACRERGARLTLLSTDFVFDGTADRPYREDDPPNPLSAYGQSKRDGECAVAESLPDHQIVRTAWLFGAGKRNFVSAIAGALAKDSPVRVVEDEIGSPTYAVDLAKGLVALSQKDARGIFHLVNKGQCSRFELARKIAELTGYDWDRIVPIHASDWVSPAPRPAWSVLDCARAEALGVKPQRHWAEAVADYLRREGLARELQTEVI